MDFRIVGYFENGFRHVSNRVRPIHIPADMKGLSHSRASEQGAGTHVRVAGRRAESHGPY